MGLGRVKGSIAQIARGKMRRAYELVYAINFEKGRFARLLEKEQDLSWYFASFEQLLGW